MSEAKQILETIINNFLVEKFSRFFREKSRQFVAQEENYARYNDDGFKNGLKLGEINFSDDDRMIICTFEVKKELSEHAGKKTQYEKAKAILRSSENQIYSAGIFIFYDQNGNFRFSLIYPEAIDTKRQWNNFRRFTYFVSRDFTNKTFKQRIGDGDFSSLEKIKDAFSVEKVTKEFYQDIANWYFWAVEHSIFPKGAEEEENGRNIAIIRLITRMIFIWFMRERGLVPKDLFDSKIIGERLNDLSQDESTYYKAILQNLFFATLSTKTNERDFRSKKRFQGKNKDFGNQYVYRYRNLFKKPDEIKIYFKKIPFLNGGLFECLDDGRNDDCYIDGFTERKEYQPKVPNYLFFSQEQKVDLNLAYGTKNKTYKVRGLLDILYSFNFTIDENSPDDQEVALDPELLGRVFENLLASFNPETSTTARKATGSYYTPREIVDYMVTEALKAYFKTHLSAVSNLNKKIAQLFSTENEKNPFDKLESKKIVELIESVRIVDPAVGSGAFPMGALNKLVFILNKVDQGNELWKQAQLSAADTIPDSRIKQDTKNRIEEFFKGKNADYGRKLYLIQKCIYGVDIQQIAVEIAKLRFFISLLVDEEIDKTKENWGIEPLPNLDFKIMQGNSLLEEYEGIKLFDEKLLNVKFEDNSGRIKDIEKQLYTIDRKLLKFYQSKPEWMRNKTIERPSELSVLESEKKRLTDNFKYEKDKSKINVKNVFNPSLFSDENKSESIRKILNSLHKQFFETNEKKAKDKIKKQIEKMEWELIEATLKEQNKTSEVKKLEQFKKSNTKPFFLWKLHFADVFEQKGGFDIVIANPPYIKEYTQKSAFDGLKDSLYYKGKMDLWYLFACKSIDFLKNNSGILAFIAQNNWTTSYGASILRNKVIQETQILNLVDFSDYKIFKCAGIQTMVMIFKKNKSQYGYKFDYRKIINSKPVLDDIKNLLNRDKNQNCQYLDFFIDRKKLLGKSFVFNDLEVESVLNKISKISNFKLKVKEVAQGIVAAPDKYFLITELSNFNDAELCFIKPFYTFTSRFSPKKSDLYIFYICDRNFRNKNIDNYPNIKKHFQKFKKELKEAKNKYGTPQKPYFYLHRERDEEFFKTGPKIVGQTRTNLLRFLYTEEEYYGSRAMNFIKTDRLNLKYLIGIMNSNLFYFWLNHKGKKLGSMLHIDKESILDLPIINPKDVEQKKIKKIVDKILAITKSRDYLENSAKKEEVKNYEKQIDQLVYKLYELTDEEIKTIEKSK